MLENNKHIDKINIYFLQYKLSDENINNLKIIRNNYNNCNIIFIDAVKYNDEYEKLGINKWGSGGYVTWFKLLAISDINIDSDRILYIDSDTIVTGDLTELIELDFKNNILAMSYDYIYNKHKKNIGFNYNDSYYNAGVILINYKKWIEDNYIQKIYNLFNKQKYWAICEQDFINTLFKNKILLLNVKYNFSSAYYAYNLKLLIKTNNLKENYFYKYENIMEDYYSPKIIHCTFGLTGKPWETGNNHPNKYIWNKYMKISPWGDISLHKSKKTFSWILYKILPSFIFMKIYKLGVYLKLRKMTKELKN